MLRSLGAALGVPGWEYDMAHVNPKEWHPRHQLDEAQVRLRFNQDGSVQVTAVGRSKGQRADLWRHSETVGSDESVLQPADIAHHMLLVALQDRPRSLEAFQAGLVGGGWEDIPLPF
jgi:hypothetical protein